MATQFMDLWGIQSRAASYAILFLVLAVVYLSCYIAYNLWFHPIANIPGPRLAAISPIWILDTLRRRKLSPIVRIAPNELSFSTVDSLEIIYRGANPRNGLFTKRGTLQDIITNFILPGPNIITMHDRVAHRALKKRIEPAFTLKALHEQEPIIKDHIRALCEVLDKTVESGQDSINITEYLSGMLWNMTSDLAFGEPLLEGQRQPFETFVESCTGMFQVVEALNFCLPLIGPALRVVLEALPYPTTSGHIIEAKRLRSCMDRSHERRDFLTSIMEDQKATGLTLTDRELQSNSAALFMAGYGTTAISISGILYQILREPSHMARLQKEVRDAFKNTDEMEGSALHHLPWLNACINESLRLLPPINTRFTGRTSPGTTISGLFVPPGVFVSADIYTIQRSPEYWADATAFRPERWIETEPDSIYAGDVKAAFKPFLLGSRACIGRQMALQTLRLILVHIAFRYDFSMVDRDEFVWERDVPSSLVWTDYRKINVQLSLPQGKVE